MTIIVGRNVECVYVFQKEISAKVNWKREGGGRLRTVLSLPPSHTCDVLAIAGTPYMAIL
ncbi:hypothetical protein K443DRAFT_632542 [Laccaria amethystina LaAM-08-1]|uniref:Uncharacterized protein n=1 Tax=Laccaria amethystina LaAM-08-1 TaxID=1095629 RepID=A0A0C9XM47_9AGAR|nr:hypothetical protein K443DRAFT_632542 [Laccaria amethystina LaAM-08-1]